MRTLCKRVSIGWCRTFHPAPCWPIHGRYYCPACLRSYPVPWPEGNQSEDRTLPNLASGFALFEFGKDRG